GKLAPGEQCEPSLGIPPGGPSNCTLGGTIYCSNTCQIACTAGTPYTGTCGDGSVQASEACDDGVNNGQPGYCNVTCSGYGSFCGDGVLSPVDEFSIGCECDSGAQATCNATSFNYTPIAGQACTKAGCAAPGTAHEYLCVQADEECDVVAGLAAYSCPANKSLYCDGSCQRACTTVDVDASGMRRNVPVYEHYFEQGTEADHDYTLLPKADTPYVTKGIAFYAYPSASALGADSVWRFKSQTTADHYLSTNAAPKSGYASLGAAFRAYRLDPSLPHVVPVYEFREFGTIPTGPTNYSAYYSFNDASAVQATDYSSGGNNGTLMNGAFPSPVNPVIPNLQRGVSLDGVNDHARIPHSAGDNDGSSGSITVSGWVYRTQAADWQRFVTKSFWDPGASPWPSPYLSYHSQFNQTTAGDDKLSVAVNAAGKECWSGTTTQIPLNTWTHLAFSFNGSTLSVYYNGVLEASNSGPLCAGAISTNTLDVGIGAGLDPLAPPAFQNPFAGSIDDVRIYNYALSASEISAIYLNALGGTIGSGEHYYSRSTAPRLTTQSTPYAIMNGGGPVFHALVGPFQETCGNDVLEGNETCEPDTYQTPIPAQSSLAQQYQCGAIFTTLACQTYGGYCGDASHDAPFEQCDEGTANTCARTGSPCTSDFNCSVSSCLGGVCDLDPGTTCTKNADCKGVNTCQGNGTTCDNSGGNCVYCSDNCSQGFLPRNFCGDGIVNYGADGSPGGGDDIEICDSGLQNNGRSGFCNATCSGPTGAVCGNLVAEGLCSLDTTTLCNPMQGRCLNNPLTSCNPYPLPTPPYSQHDICDILFPGDQCIPYSVCEQSGLGSCDGEICDAGPRNGTWSFTCDVVAPGSLPYKCNKTSDCALAAGGPGGNCIGVPEPYCSFSCQSYTDARCGDGFIQLPNSQGTDEACDHGVNNGKPGYCNTACTDITPSVCGDGVVAPGTCSVSVEPGTTIPLKCDKSDQCPLYISGRCSVGGAACDPTAQPDTCNVAGNGSCVPGEVCNRT
ncbi:MAG: LamG domain-containing protein, partial [Patescibacteria group bacterium]